MITEKQVMEAVEAIPVSDMMLDAGEIHSRCNESIVGLSDAVDRVYCAMEYTRRLEAAKALLIEDGWALSEVIKSASRA